MKNIYCKKCKRRQFDTLARKYVEIFGLCHACDEMAVLTGELTREQFEWREHRVKETL